MSNATRPAHFLLVEDDNAHADLMLMSFEENKVANTVSRVADGEQALDYLHKRGQFIEAKRPDVILLDLKIPKIEGHAVLEWIKANPDLRAIPVVVLTTSSNSSDIQRAYENNANSFLTKPFEFGDFQRLVRDLGLYWSVWNRPPIHAPAD
ncbi:MAG: response regulator [Phycisphaerales bacterium JB059]